MHVEMDHFIGSDLQRFKERLQMERNEGDHYLQLQRCIVVKFLPHRLQNQAFAYSTKYLAASR